MSILGIDLGGSKIASALFSQSGALLTKESVSLGRRKGTEVGALIVEQIKKYQRSYPIKSIGISVPGISRHKTGTVWAPNIEGWEDYALLNEIKQLAGSIPVNIDSDRVCSILGEQWQGNAKNCRDAIFISVGTGIGAGILVDGNVLRGTNDIAGAIGWMALTKPFQNKYTACGCFEFYASGPGIPKFAEEVLASDPTGSILRIYPKEKITTRHVFDAFEEEDPVASIVIRECISYWGMAAANLVSIFNPEKIIFGGGVFGPAAKLIKDIKKEAARWAQPISMAQVSFEHSQLESDAAVYGAGFLGLENRIT
jgi:glucokinase